MSYLDRQFADLRGPLRALVEEHGRIADEPLHLALAYAGRDSGQLSMFELISNFGGNLIDPESQLFETTYAGQQVFPTADPSPDLHLVLTSPAELREALRSNWPMIEEIKKAIAAEQYDVLFKDDLGGEMLSQLAAAVAAA